MNLGYDGPMGFARFEIGVVNGTGHRPSWTKRMSTRSDGFWATRWPSACALLTDSLRGRGEELSGRSTIGGERAPLVGVETRPI